MTSARQKPDIRQITRLVPPAGNLVQGQSELQIDERLARLAADVIAASQNHYSPAEGVPELRRAIASKIERFNRVAVDPEAKPFEVLVTHGGTGALVAIAEQYLADGTTLVFEPYYPYHRRIIEAAGGGTQTFALDAETLAFDAEELRSVCRKSKDRAERPLKAIIVCTPTNPTGKVFRPEELQTIADVCHEFDLLCIADEVYEHYVTSAGGHVSIAALDGMRERTVTVNSFSKSWNVSGWRLGYVYGEGRLVAPLVNTSNVFYVCEPTPLQKALAGAGVDDAGYYDRLRERFAEKRRFATEVLERIGFEVYESGSAFYVWARTPEEFAEANSLNERLISEAGAAGVPGGAFADSAAWDGYMRFCIAREDAVLESAFARITSFFNAK